jgi:hypothetical protein
MSTGVLYQQMDENFKFIVGCNCNFTGSIPAAGDNVPIILFVFVCVLHCIGTCSSNVSYAIYTLHKNFMVFNNSFGSPKMFNDVGLQSDFKNVVMQ